MNGVSVADEGERSVSPKVELVDYNAPGNGEFTLKASDIELDGH